MELYIDDNLVDLDSGTTIAITFQASDYSDPTAIKNSFSKTVSLAGTSNNNKIFGHCYKLDRTILEGDSFTGVNFDSKKRVPFVLYDNGDILEKGYIKLDSIKRVENIITYDITLFGGIGDFFYNLAYNEDEEEAEKTLASLYYKFVREDGSVYTKNEEDSENLFQWNKEFINGSWNKLREWETGDTKNLPRNVEAYITASPMLQGIYDDFDNDKVLVNVTDDIKDFFPESKTVIDGDKTVFYGTRGDYGLVELPRECVEHEVKDLRSNQQHPAIKTSLILDAICDPENNGGYEVQFPKMVKGDDLWAYYHKSYYIFDRFDFDESDNNSHTPLYLYFDLSLQESAFPPSSAIPQWSTLLGTADKAVVFDFTSFKSPKVELNIQTTIGWKQEPIIGYGYPQNDKMYLCYDIQPTNHGCSGIAYWVETYDENDALLGRSRTYIISTHYPDLKNTLPFGKISQVDNLLAQKLKCDSDDIVFIEGNLNKQNDSGKYFFDKNVKIDVAVDSKKVKLKLFMQYVRAQQIEGQTPMMTDYIIGYDGSRGYYGNVTTAGLVNNEDYISGYFDGSISPVIQKTNVNKQVLFGGTPSPFDFLVSFTKMFNLRYRIDKAIPKIYIERLEEYYQPDINEINDAIDRGSEITINPTLAEEKWHKYGLPTPETYAQHLYFVKNKTDYGTMKFDTGYNFNAETNDLFEDNVFKSLIPYRLQSPYFTVSDRPNITNLNYTYTLFKNWDGSKRADGSQYSEVMATDRISAKKSYGNSMLCAFDAENNSVDDITGSLCFFNGFYQDKYILTDNLQAMLDINGNPCYLYTTSEYGYPTTEEGCNKVRIAIKVNSIPKFSKDYRGYSLDFILPNYSMDGTTAEDLKGLETIYNLHWKKYAEDLYAKDSKSVELMMRVMEQPQDMMRKFYLFDNTVWVVSKITDYNPQSVELTKVEFVKVDDVQNYITYSFSDLVKRRTPPVPVDPEPEPPTPEHEYVFTVKPEKIDASYNQTSTKMTVVSTKDGEDIPYTVIPSCDWVTYSNGYLRYTENDGDARECEIDFIQDETGDRKTVTLSQAEGGWEYVFTVEPTVFRATSGATTRSVTVVSTKDGVNIPYTAVPTKDWLSYSNGVISVEANTETKYRYGDIVFTQTETGEIRSIVLRQDAKSEPVVGCYDVKLTLNDGTTQTDTFSDGKIPLFKYANNSDIISVVIGDCITSIGRETFVGCDNLTSVTIGNSVTSISQSLFVGCHNLTSIDIPNSVTSIEGTAFVGCHNLTSIDIPNSVTSIGDGAFMECESLTSIVIPDSVTSIGYGAFSNCTSLTSVTIGNSVTSISERAFMECESLTSIVIPDSVTSIGEMAFYGCTSLASIIIPNSVTSIGNTAFYCCDSLTSITIPDSVTSIGHNAFVGCHNLTSIIIPDSITSIGDSTFSHCTSLASVKLGNSLQTIDGWAFYGCSSLTSITIPDSVTSIGEYVFYFCEYLTSINYDGTKAQWKAITKGDGWHDTVPTTIVHCTDGDIDINA